MEMGDGLARVGAGLVAIGAGIALAGGAVGTGLVQSAVGSSGVGAISEKPEVSGSVLLYYVIPETILIFAFVISILMLLWLGQTAVATTA